MYKEEAAKQQEKIQKMIEDCEEEYNVAKQKEVLQETLSMLPGTKQRIDSSYEDLDMIIVRINSCYIIYGQTNHLSLK
jgi:tubulin-specific chaperone A